MFGFPRIVDEVSVRIVAGSGVLWLSDEICAECADLRLRRTPA